MKWKKEENIKERRKKNKIKRKHFMVGTTEKNSPSRDGINKELSKSSNVKDVKKKSL